MRRSLRQHWLLLAIFAVMAILEVAIASRPSLWVDEIFSLAMATGHSLEHPAAVAEPARGDFVEVDYAVPASEMQHYLKHESPPASPMRVIRAVLLSDTSPPLYYLLLYGWTILFGTTDFAIRSLSIVCSLASFPLVAAIASRTGGGKAVVPACLLFALTPLGLYFSTEARMYPLLLLCLLAVAWTGLVLQQEGGSAYRYLLWIGTSAAGLFTHYFFLFPWLAMIVYLFIVPGQLDRRKLLGSLAAVGLLVFPWYLVAAQNSAKWRITAGWLEVRPMGFRQLHATRNQLLQFFAPGEAGLWQSSRWLSLAATVLFVTIAAAAAWRVRQRLFSGSRLLLWLWLLAACAAPTIIDLFQHSYLSNVARYALAGLPPAYFLTAIGIASFGKRVRVAVLLAIVLVWAMPIARIFREDSRAREPFKKIAQFVSSDARPSDLVLVHSIPSGVLGVARYSRPTVAIASWVQQLGTRRVPESLLALARGRSRILYVKVHQLSEPAPEEEWLRAHAATAHETRFGLGTVVDFRPQGANVF